jgi:hypothetical protein
LPLPFAHTGEDRYALRTSAGEAIQSAVENFSKADPSRTWTPEEIGKFGGLGGLGPVAVGCSPATIADELERWVTEADVDGFNLAYAITPGTFVDFIDLVVPELQRRGLVWEDYAGNTLRQSIYGPGPPTRRPPGRAVPYPPDVGAQTRNLGDLTAWPLVSATSTMGGRLEYSVRAWPNMVNESRTAS